MSEGKFLYLCRQGRTLCLLLLLGGTALYINPYTYNNFDLPKTVWISFFGLLLVGLTFIALVRGRSFWLSLSYLNVALLVFLVINFLSLVKAQSWSLAKDHIRFLLMIYLIILVLQDYLNGNRRRVMILGWALVASAFLTGVWVLYQDFTQAFAPGRLPIVPRLSDWRVQVSAIRTTLATIWLSCFPSHCCSTYTCAARCGRFSRLAYWAYCTPVWLSAGR